MRRWALPDEPRGVAVGADGTIYVGLATPQAVIAVDPKTGAVRRRIVLDSAEIASTKELVTLRTSSDRTRLYIANGSDESATILSLPNLGVIREITMEGETIRDVVPDPKGRYVYLLGRRVHVFDGEGNTELRALDVEEPTAIATSANGKTLAVFSANDDTATMSVFDTNGFTEVSRQQLKAGPRIEAAMFADGDRSLVAFTPRTILEKRAGGGASNSIHVCLPENSGPQIATLTGSSSLVYAERKCSASGVFAGEVDAASLYGVDAYALAYDDRTNTIVATDRDGHLTIYNVPRAATAQ